MVQNQDCTTGLKPGSILSEINANYDALTPVYESQVTLFFTVADGCPITSCLLFQKGCSLYYAGSRLTLAGLTVSYPGNDPAGWSESVCLICSNGFAEVAQNVDFHLSKDCSSTLATKSSDVIV